MNSPASESTTQPAPDNSAPNSSAAPSSNGAALSLEQAAWRPARSPQELGETGLDAVVLRDLMLRFAYTVTSFTSRWATEKTCLPLNLVDEICWGLKEDHLLQILGQEGSFNYTYSATDQGRREAARAMEVCGYLGPAPVCLADYWNALEKQDAQRPETRLPDVQQALSSLVLAPEVVEVAALAAASRRSLFLFGPAGNGKTSMGRLLHRVLGGDIWLPYSISVGHNVIRLFDKQVHEPSDQPPPEGESVDRRWVRVKRPFVIAGGEMTMNELDLAYSPSLRYYEAPPHVKANGGTFLIDDFGRQRIEPHELLNRWIVPLESQIDHLALHTGQKIEVPFRLLLIVATNLKVSDVADPAFLRRMGYRIHVETPTPEQYASIFHRYAEQKGVTAAPELVAAVLQRYEAEEREFRASEPRDLIERMADTCRLRGEPLTLSQEILDVAWRGYFGGA
jgi:predicted ATPase with chaperone activity